MPKITESSAERALGRVFWWLVAALCWFFALYQIRYVGLFQLGDEMFFQKSVKIYREFPASIFFFGHILGCCSAVALAPFLFLTRDRFAPRKRLTPIYLFLVTVGGIWAYYYAFRVRPFNVSSYIILTIVSLWVYTTVKAVQELRAGNVVEHRKWMLINFWSLFGAVLWRIVWCFVNAEFDLFSATPKTADYYYSEQFMGAYHSTWFLSFIFSMFLAALCLRRLLRRVGPTGEPAE